MPIVKDRTHSAPAPKGGHLGILTDELTQEIFAVERGNTVYIIEDPTKADKVFRFLLVSASHKRLVFKCHCGNPKCTAVYTFTASKSGQHLSAQQR